MEISIAAVCGLCLLFCVGGFLASYIYFRRKIVDFTDEVCESAQEILRQSQGLLTHDEAIAQVADCTIRIEDGKIVESRW